MTDKTEGQERVAALQSLRQVVVPAVVDVPAAISRWLTEWDQTKTGNALSAVLMAHEHKLMDEYVRLTTDVGKAKYSRCETCGNLPNGMLWCPTLMVIAVQLGVDS